MAVSVDVSSPASGTAAIYSLITRLCAAGWLVKAWSDATTLTSGVSLSSNPYGSASSGAGNLGNTSAWFRIASADGSREWLFQRGSADQTWTISRSKAGFTGGTPNATTVGTASDATALFSAAQAFPTSTWRMFISCETASPYGFVCFGITNGGGNVLHFLVDEPLAASTYDTSDTDPYFWWGRYDSPGYAGSTGGIGAVMGASLYKRFTGAGSNQLSHLLSWHYNNVGTYDRVAPAASTTQWQVGTTPSTLVEAVLPVGVARPGTSSSTTGWIGICNRLKWGSIGGRANGYTFGPSGGAYYIFMAGILVPWDSSTPALS